MIDEPWQNFLCPEFWTKFQRKVLLFWRYPNFFIIYRYRLFSDINDKVVWQDMQSVVRFFITTLLQIYRETFQ